MRSFFRWFGSACIIIFVASIFTHRSHGGHSGNSLLALHKQRYTFSESESKVLDFLLDEEKNLFISGGNSMVGEDLIRASANQVAYLYSENQVAGDQKYYNKELLLAGEIHSIDSGINNEPYLSLYGVDEFNYLQVHFKKESLNIDLISHLQRGQEVRLVCTGDGVWIGSPRFKDCVFTSDYADNANALFKAALQNYLQGAQTNSDAIKRVPALIIALTRDLPSSSTCFTDRSSCRKDLDKIMNNAQFKSKTNGVIDELNAKGFQISLFTSK